MYLVVDRSDVKTVSNVVNRLVETVRLDSIYYDSEEVKPIMNTCIEVIKATDLFSAMLSCCDDNYLYIISTARNKQNPEIMDYMKEVV